MMREKLLMWGDDFVAGFEAGMRQQKRDARLAKKAYTSIVFVGMGGSGMAGRLIQEVLLLRSKLAVEIVDGPLVPLHVQTGSLAFVTSYSGNTWETLHAYNELQARAVDTIVLTSGGTLYRRAADAGNDTYLLPSGCVPRAALAYMFGMQLGILNALSRADVTEFVADIKAHWEGCKNVVAAQETYADYVRTMRDAQTVHVWGVYSDSVSAAYRLQTQLNENSKVTAVMRTLPELNHNLLVGFDAQAQQEPIVILTTDFAHKLLKKSVESVLNVFKKRGVALYKPTLLGDTWARQLAYSLWWADFASYYLGQERGCQIEQTPFIDNVKETFSRKMQEL